MHAASVPFILVHNDCLLLLQAVLEELGNFNEARTACIDALNALQHAVNVDAEVSSAKIGLAVRISNIRILHMQ